MKRNIKEELQNAFASPEPLHKETFCKMILKEAAKDTSVARTTKPDIQTGHAAGGIVAFLGSQIAYIRKWIWWLSAFVFAVSCLEARSVSDNAVWVISALMPVLALTMIAESGRSEIYEMAELEMATRFSLRSVVLARLGILGLENLLILILVIPTSVWNHTYGILQTGIYILTPYLLTVFIGLAIVRRFKEREAVYFCTGIAVCISFLTFFAYDSIPQFYQEKYLTWWGVGMLALGMGMIRQYFNMIKQTEELD